MSSVSSPASSRTRIFPAIFSSVAQVNRRRIHLLAACALTQTFCAQIGTVLPPSTHLPRPITDLQVQRDGPQVRLRWTAPAVSSDGVRWHGPIQYNLCAWPGLQAGSPAPARNSPQNAGPQIAEPPAVAPQVPSPARRDLAADQTPGGAIMPPCPRLLHLSGNTVPIAALGPDTMATLALYAVNADGRGAGWSNLAPVTLTPVAPPPTLLTATPTPDGIDLRWQLPRNATAFEAIDLYRQLDVEAPVRLATLPPTSVSFTDSTTAWNQHYRYWLRSAAGTGPTRVESLNSNSLEVTPADVFPPPVPTGLQVVAGVNGVDLSWNPVSARNLAGYNVYRRAAGGLWQKRNVALLPTPVFHDPEPPAPGSEFAVTSVSDTGHESSHSERGAVEAH